MNNPLARLGIFLTCVLAVYAWMSISGLLDGVTPLTLRDLIQSMGPAGVLLYISLFVVGLLVYVPGVLFILAGGLIFGTGTGFFITLAATNIAIAASFVVIRLLGGDLSTHVTNTYLHRLSAGLSSHPLKSVVVLRMLFSTAPGLNFILAISSLSYRQHFLGTFIGLIAPVALFVYSADWLLAVLYS